MVVLEALHATEITCDQMHQPYFCHQKDLHYQRYTIPKRLVYFFKIASCFDSIVTLQNEVEIFEYTVFESIFNDNAKVPPNQTLHDGHRRMVVFIVNYLFW